MVNIYENKLILKGYEKDFSIAPAGKKRRWPGGCKLFINKVLINVLEINKQLIIHLYGKPD
jgi:hypothetical protein